jgi:hypothetical protein
MDVLLNVNGTHTNHVVANRPLTLTPSDRPWRHPFDRMYFVDEDGREKPTTEAVNELSTIVMFRSGVWFMAIVDMFFKFWMVSL